MNTIVGPVVLVIAIAIIGPNKFTGGEVNSGAKNTRHIAKNLKQQPLTKEITVKNSLEYKISCWNIVFVWGRK